MLPGDIVLVTDNRLVSRLIALTQRRGGFHASHARWTRIAMYINDGLIVEATPFGGVRLGRFVDMTFGRELLVRRVVDEAVLPMENRLRVGIAALSGLRRGYSWMMLPYLGWQALYAGL